MSTRRVASMAFVLLCCAFVLRGAAQAQDGARPLSNLYGAPTVRPGGGPINYTNPELLQQSHEGNPATHRRVSAPAAGGIPAAWTYAAFGSGIGVSGIVLGRANGSRELYAGGSVSTFGANDYWYALRYAPSAGRYDQVFVSELMPSAIVRLGSADVTGSIVFEIVVALESGEIRIYDQDSRRPLAGFVAAPDVSAMALADLDGDGKSEILVTTPAGLFVYDGAGTLLWNLPGVSGSDIAVGQMDDDAALEIATTSGDVIDAGTHLVQWHWPAQFGFRLRVADVDGDGRSELIAAENWYFVWAYDVERQLPKWSLPISLDVGAIDVADVDCDGQPELIVGQGQWGSIIAYDTTTQAQKWSIPNPEHGVTNVVIGDVDGDGRDEVVWGAGATSTGPDHLYVVDLQTQTLEWSSPDLVGPFLGTATGDIDGDGQPEIVAISTYSDAGYSGGRILVFDARTRALRAVSDPIGNGFYPIEDFKLRNVDSDAALEIVLAMNYLYDGVVQVYDFDGGTNTFALAWENPEHPSGSPFTSVEIADADGDGGLDVIAGGSRAHTGAEGVFVHVYDYATKALKWRSFQLGSYWSAIRDVVVEDAGGGHPDILAIDEGTLYAFDGVTKESLQITPGSFTVLRPDPYASSRSVFLGDDAGGVSRYDRGSSTYALGTAYPLGGGAVDGITPISAVGALVGAAGKLSFFPSLAAAPAWTSADFGAPTGRYASLGAGLHSRFFAGSLFGVVEVAPGGTLVSVYPSSGGSSGGTQITAIGSGFTAGSALYVGGEWADPSLSNGVDQVQGPAPALPAGTLQTVTVLNPDTSSQSLEDFFFVDFLDVEPENLFHNGVAEIMHRRVTAGCGPGVFCPFTSVSRAQMAVFLVRAGLGANLLAPRASGGVFGDVACGDFGADEIELVATLGVTGGCGGGLYCPGASVTRAQMAALLLKMSDGGNYVPPPASGVFADVPTNDPFAPWIEELAARGITAGCGGGNYCPNAAVSRGQMAVFLLRGLLAP